MARTGPSSLKRIALAVLFAGITAAATLWLGQRYDFLQVSPAVLRAARWLAIAGLLGYALARRSLTISILVSIVVGAEIGHNWPGFAVHLRVLSLIFLRLIKTIIAPLLFGTLVVGIAGHANLKKVGRMGVKALIYFEVVTTLALLIGLAAINISKAGVGVRLPAAEQSETLGAPPRQSAGDILLHVFPENIARSVAEGQLLQVVVFSLLFAIALSLLSEAKRRPMLAFAESLAETMFKFTNIVMLFAPIGVGAAIAYTLAQTGMGFCCSCSCRWLCWRACPSENSSVWLPSRLRLRLPRRARKRRCRGPWRRWKPSACRDKSSRSSSPPATASIWTAARSICPWRPSLSRRPRASISASASKW